MTGVETEQRVERAYEFHKRGFNCAQCVACTCADIVGLDEAVAFKATEGLGGGIGGYTETCGAILGGASILGFATSDGPHNPTTKKETYRLTKQLADRFRENTGSTLCGEIKGRTGGTAPLRSCDDCIADAVRITLDLL